MGGLPRSPVLGWHEHQKILTPAGFMALRAIRNASRIAAPGLADDGSVQPHQGETPVVGLGIEAGPHLLHEQQRSATDRTVARDREMMLGEHGALREHARILEAPECRRLIVAKDFEIAAMLGAE